MELIQASSSNYRKGRNSAVKFLVVHFTANQKDTARNNCKYFQTGGRNASAHYFIDENEIIQSVLETDSAWAVGDGQGKYGITNDNSLSLEMCNSVGYNAKVEARTIDFLRELKRKYPNAEVVRHFDASRKNCPKYYVENPQAWAEFKNKLQGGLTMSQYEELKQMIENLGKKIDSVAIKYGYVDQNMPSWARASIQKLKDRKLLNGDENGNLQLNDEMLRIFTVLDRAGVFDR